MEKEEHPAPPTPDDGETLIYGQEGITPMGAAELRAALGLPSGEHIQDYGEISTIGIGGMGAVFSAREPGLNRDVALKLLRPQYRNQSERIENFIREARTTAQIDHPNIVPVHRLGVFDDVGVYFTMKRVEGETLRTVLRKLAENHPGYRRKFSLIRLLEIFLGACNGVAFAHRHGILHGDLKPANLMVGDYGEVMVMDWGMARYRPDLDQGDDNAKMDLDPNLPFDVPPHKEPAAPSSKVGGTPAFMAPELITGVSGPSEQADIYALGAILYTILTWRSSPFNPDLSSEEILMAAARGSFPPPRKAANRRQPVPLELEAICLKAMNRDRGKRYPHVSALISDVRNYLEDYPVAAYSPTPFYRLAKLIRRRPLIPAAIAAALLTWVGFYGFHYLNNLSRSGSLISLAEYSYMQGRAYNRDAQRTFRLLENASPEDARRGQTELVELVTEMQNHYNAALELVSRVTEFGGREALVNRMVRDIFRSQFDFQLLTENDEALRTTLQQCSTRWQEFFQQALADDSALARLAARIRARTGTLLLHAEPGEKLRLTLRRADGTPEPELENLVLERPEYDFTLPSGDYQVTLADGERKFRFPLRIPLAGFRELRLRLPEKLPPETVFVPGGDFVVSGGNPPPSFLIGKYEVTFRQYLEFWKTLPPDLRARYRAWYAFSPGSGELSPIWDDDGNLRAPFRADLPVVGISAEAAEAYCRRVGERYGMTGRLPTVREWQKAARGVDRRLYVWGDDYHADRALLADSPQAAQYPQGAAPGSFPLDRSPYGACDMNGNVRELVAPGGNAPFLTLCGGSYLTGPQLAECDRVSLGTGCAGDAGFRILLEPPEQSAEK